MDDRCDRSTLRYLEAERVKGPAGALSNVDLCDMYGNSLGSLEGVLVDPAERRLRFYVVESDSRRGPRHYLLPTDWPAQVEAGGRALKIDLDRDQLATCDEFREADVTRFSDDDLIAAMFGSRVA